MPYLDLPTAKQDLRVNHAGDDALITRLIAVAERRVVHFLGRNVYEDQPALDAARSGAPASFLAAESAYNTALDAANAVDSLDLRALATGVAVDDYSRAIAEYSRAVNGIVVDETIITATALVVAHLYEHRGDETDVVDMPQAARTLLWSYRWGNMGVGP